SAWPPGSRRPPRAIRRPSSPSCPSCSSAPGRARSAPTAPAPARSPASSPCWSTATTTTSRSPTPCAASWTGTSSWSGRSPSAGGWYMLGYGEGLKIRKAAIQTEIDAIEMEERGARDALSAAFEEQKKYEQVAETARVAAVKEVSRRETAELDEVGLRAAVRKA